MSEDNLYDTLIIGGGIAGLTAGLYCGRYRMKTLIISDTIGGEGITAGTVYNYPGFKEIDGADLMLKISSQVKALNVETNIARVETIDKNGHCFSATITSGEVFQAKTIIIARGTKHRKLGLEKEDTLKSNGVHYCVTCDAPLYRDKIIAVVGGGDSSVKGVNLVAEYVKKIYLITREKELYAEPINLEQMKKLGDTVEVLYETEVTKLHGEERLDGISLSKDIDGSKRLDVDALFVEIGSIPDTALATSLGVALDEFNYIAVDNLMKTNVDGVFAAGDAVNHFGSFKQYITAAAMGAVAATSAYNDVKTHGDLCELHTVPAQVDTHELHGDQLS